MKPARTILALVIGSALMAPRPAFADASTAASTAADPGAQSAHGGDGAPPPVVRTTVEVTAPVPMEVSVDGAVLGTTPLTLSLLPGTYTIRGARRGDKAGTSTVVLVRAGEPRKIVLPAERATAAPWVWVGVGAIAVAGGVVLGALVFSQSR